MSLAHHGYHEKHRNAAKKRASFITEHSEAGSRFLDIGCNAGDISFELLKTGMAESIHGMDLDREVVDPHLMSQERFTFLESDIAQSEFLPESDYSIYSAVHHHVLYRHGLTAAIRCIQLIVRSTERAIFFETGRIIESSYWPWQRAIRQYFRTDEEHHAYVLGSLEGAIENVELVGKVNIHGIKRWFLKLSLRPQDQRLQKFNTDLSAQITTTDQIRIRRFGSRRGGLIAMPARGNHDSPCEFACNETTGDSVFVKRHVHRPYYSRLEYEVGLQVERPWAIRPVELLPDTAQIRFPLVRQETRFDPESIPSKDRARLVLELSHIFREARAIKIGFGPDSWRFGNACGCLLDFCDLNPNNVLFARRNADIKVYVVDFEPAGTRLRYRNRLNRAAVLRTLGRARLQAAFFSVAGYQTFFIEVIRAYLKPIPARFVTGVPTLGSLVSAEIATFLGFRFRRLVDFVRDRAR